MLIALPLGKLTTLPMHRYLLYGYHRISLKPACYNSVPQFRGIDLQGGFQRQALHESMTSSNGRYFHLYGRLGVVPTNQSLVVSYGSNINIVFNPKRTHTPHTANTKARLLIHQNEREAQRDAKQARLPSFLNAVLLQGLCWGLERKCNQSKFLRFVKQNMKP